MEFLWYVLASLLAGVGTGLAGLSAATVMVPILIVLCPSFSGEAGAYQATAIALASDILGSAVTAYTYYKEKNIDLKRGWIMFVCIISMCTIGSYAAYKAGDVVLGSFTLFLTFFIGIRFLIKPDSGRKDRSVKGQKLDGKGILISLFFGLTIGFGTGFVGTGGGMMMLVVFTVFLGMDLKTAVGTSTFIMAFTALIASISHILIHPAILLEKWHVLLLCSILTTFSSLFSARFANKVSDRTVGLTAGAILSFLGGAMLLLHFWPQISSVRLLAETLSCLGRLILYIVPSVLILLIIRFFTKVPSFVFRKLLHAVAFTCFSVMVLNAQSWQAAALTSLLIAFIAYPLLSLAEKESWYSSLFVEKSHGEIKRSLLMLFGMFAAVIALSWGIFQNLYAAVAAILMWGLGDAVAALIGIPYGKHKVSFKPVNGKKSWEGSFAMFCVSLLVGFCLLYFLFSYPSVTALTASSVMALAGTAAELLSPSEWDTLTVPVVELIIALILL